MCLKHKLMLLFIVISFLFPLALAHGEEGKNSGSNIVLSPADQIILDRIDMVHGRIVEIGKGLNTCIDKVNDRINNLWITMLGGF
jgi:hypothetical protein